ncbi:MAG: heme-binding domain-containing protein [Sulfurovaceae bacterium]|nr:heme-binding domain-containing protein [Sulfurovaceae bacterium]
MKFSLKLAIGILVAAVILIQFIPYGKDHTNPPVISEPKWDSPQTRELFMKSCGDCHSNETKWPYYSNIAPISWSVYSHVEEGREAFNVSDWNQTDHEHAQKAANEVREDEMPLASYLIAHPKARLDEATKGKLIQGLVNTFGDAKDVDED